MLLREQKLSPGLTAAELRDRARKARAALASCELCARRCGADRARGECGYCGMGADAFWFREMLHFGLELELIPAHTIYLAGCNMRCLFCNVGDWNAAPTEAERWDVAGISERVRQRRREGARTLFFVGGEPTVSLPAILELLAELPGGCPVVWDSNMYMSEAARELLRGVVDVYVADLKFGGNRCAEHLADAPRYWETVTENLLFAEQTASLIVRHLLLPGHLDCCFRPALEWVAQNLRKPRLALRGEYMPPARAVAEAELNSYVRDEQYEQALSLIHI